GVLSLKEAAMKFEDILAPMSTKEFFSRYFGEAPLHLRGPANKFEGLLGWREINRIFASHRLCDGRLRVAKQARLAAQTEFLNFEGRTSEKHCPRVDAMKLVQMLRDGSQIILDDIHEMSE